MRNIQIYESHDDLQSHDAQAYHSTGGHDASDDTMLFSPPETKKPLPRVTKDGLLYFATTAHMVYLPTFPAKSHRDELSYRSLTFILDEASMQNTAEFGYLLFIYLPYIKRIIFTGDHRQLEPVQRGQLFKDLVNLDVTHFPGLERSWFRSELTTIYRSSGSFAKLSHSIRKGHAPSIYASLAENKEHVTFLTQSGKDAVTKEEIRRWVWDHGASCIIAYQNSVCHEYNAYIQQWLQSNPGADRGPFPIPDISAIERKTIDASCKQLKGFTLPSKQSQVKQFDLNLYDRIMCLKNQRSGGKMVMANGEQGYIVELDEDRKSVKVKIDGRRLACKMDLMYEDSAKRCLFSLGYAITIHKSQGSEFKALVVILGNTRASREMVYTAITRAKSRVLIVGKSPSEFVHICTSRWANRNSKMTLPDTQHVFDHVIQEALCIDPIRSDSGVRANHRGRKRKLPETCLN